MSNASQESNFSSSYHNFFSSFSSFECSPINPISPATSFRTSPLDQVTINSLSSVEIPQSQTCNRSRQETLDRTDRQSFKTCQTYPQFLKSLKLPILASHTRTQIPVHLLPHDFIESLDSEYKKSLCYQLCLVCWHVTGRTQCPKQLQLKFACAVKTKQDVFLNVGTGFGKTLASILLQLLSDGEVITIIISPLKRLQASQAESLQMKYGLCTIVVNEDTPSDDHFWKVIFGPAVVWAAMTATATSQALKSIEKVVLQPNYLKLQATSNRSNIMYASHCVPGRIDQPENYACFLSTPFDLAHQKRVLIFRDNMDAVVDIARYLDSLLPLGYRGRGVVHYHSMMSDTYLARAHNDFTHPDGICKILVSTASESTGIDHPDVEIVCIAGLPSNVMDLTQRGGRAVRQISGDGLCVLFYEKWAREIDLGDYDLNLEDGLELDSIDFSLDIDRPRRLTLNIKSLPQDRASMACVLLTRRVLCMRAFFAKCMRDNAPGAVDFSTVFCCDSHGNQFNLRNFLPGTLYNPTLTADSRKEDAHLVSKTKQRSSITQKKLYQKLESWRFSAHQEDLLSPVRPVYYILSDSHINTLASSLPHTIHSGQDVIKTLEQTHSWGLRWANPIAKIISNFDQCNEKIRSPEFIEDSDCDESEWDAQLM
ncbi:P-loop containing nucleoside triphosphate hydrolase protein [Dendrothele bispora CBS 962.96]|uniref:DNA 3'-5' helicase n=1 Tax=Dendrothele bispora (strain CBS 962.96) TaxID=1314807 RepID=A0A4S8MC91_DENBC|nr:P-loop containing nucleoside triphosphate hydrolase protein [Dendrothele bispora CBS 962.96]